MTYFKNSALIFLEVTKPNKHPEILYISHGSSNLTKSDLEFEKSAIAYCKADDSYIEGTKFILKGIQKFETQDDYINFLQYQISDYLKAID